MSDDVALSQQEELNAMTASIPESVPCADGSRSLQFREPARTERAREKRLAVCPKVIRWRESAI